MKRIKNADFEILEQALEEINTSRTDIDAFKEDLNAELARVFEQFTSKSGHNLEQLIAQHNELTESLGNKVGDHLQSMQDYFEDRADAWHESEGADEFNEWYDQWESFQGECENALDAPELNEFQWELNDALELPSQMRGE